MAIFLTKENIESFCGDVLPLQLLSDTEELAQEPIRWTADSDRVKIRTFQNDEPMSFTNGVLLTLMQPGKSCVRASCRGVEYTCTVTAREPMRVSSDDPMQYFIGDLHTHTSSIHKHDVFAVRETGFPEQVIGQLLQEGKMDFGIISDHSDVLNQKDFFRGFTDTENAQPMDLVMFPGSESEVNLSQPDRYGVPHKNAGEVVLLGSDVFHYTDTWEEFLDKLEDSPFTVGTFAHPQVVGGGGKFAGIWNFRFAEHNSPRMRQLMRLIETGRGFPRCENLIHEHAYSVALDCGFRVCPTSSSDCHGPKWGYSVYPGKTVVMAPEKTKEAILDAIRNNRVYATASGNVKLRYTVNGMTAPADLPEATRYRFHVEATCFHEDPDTVPVICQVISDGGVCVKVIEGEELVSCDFTVESDTARYFFLRLVDSLGNKTWSVPVWTGRAFDPTPAQVLVPLDKTGFTAAAADGTDASALVDDDPYTVWTSPETTASVTIDMHKTQTVTALGHYPRMVTQAMSDALGLRKEYTDWIKELPYEYRIAVSEDGQNFETKAQGVFRSFGGEEIIRFAPCAARYLRLEVLSTCGKASQWKQFADAKVAVAELTVY